MEKNSETVMDIHIVIIDQRIVLICQFIDEQPHYDDLLMNG